MKGYLRTNNKRECVGCEACRQACNKNAIDMFEDEEGFRYPIINTNLCVGCGMCNSVCSVENNVEMYTDEKYVFGGYSLDSVVRFESTSGGAFSEIVDSFCDDNYVIFGAEAKGINVIHNFCYDKSEIQKFRKSKYSQSIMGNAYNDVKRFLLEGKKVLFSGTPCQIAGLKVFLKTVNQENLLTVEVICEGVPSPLYLRKYEVELEKKYGKKIEMLDYRYTGGNFRRKNGKWDFEIMKIKLHDCVKEIKIDRWLNPFWSIWIGHLMSRPSCYECKYAQQERCSDITMGDLWGIHLFCPELYGDNGGSSLVIANSIKGKEILLRAQEKMYGHELDFFEALKYQGPMRDGIKLKSDRERFMNDLKGDMSYKELNKKWFKKPTLKLLWKKYVWGNSSKIRLWKLLKGRYKIH